MNAIDIQSKNGPLPTPSAIEVAGRTHKALFAAYVAILVLAALFTWLVWRASNKQQELVKLDADARIAEAGRDAARALRDAATANSTAAAANERATTIEADNLVLKGSVGAVEIELAKQRERAAKAERELLELQRRVADRHVTSEQRALLIDLLKGKPKGELDVTCMAEPPEPCNFAHELVDPLREIGWTIKRVDVVVFAGENPTGLTITARTTGNPYAIALRQALGGVGFPAKEELRPNLTGDTVLLLVGHKA